MLSLGADTLLGLGYEDHKNGKRNGARLLRLEKTNNFSVHDIVLVDAPMFHFVLNICTNGEAYNMAIRGGDWGGLDGVDITGNNLWVHDVSISSLCNVFTMLTALEDHGHQQGRVCYRQVAIEKHPH
jgi:rhamnogalacturonan hydrolase